MADERRSGEDRRKLDRGVGARNRLEFREKLGIRSHTGSDRRLAQPDRSEGEAVIREATEFSRRYLRDGITSGTITDHVIEAHRLIGALVGTFRAHPPDSELSEGDVDLGLILEEEFGRHISAPPLKSIDDRKWHHFCSAVCARLSYLLNSKPFIRAREPVRGTHLRGDGKWCEYLYGDNGVCNKCGFATPSSLEDDVLALEARVLELEEHIALQVGAVAALRVVAKQAAVYLERNAGNDGYAAGLVIDLRALAERTGEDEIPHERHWTE